MDEIVSIIISIFGKCKHHNHYKNQISVDCPVCSQEKNIEHDGKGNLEINYKYGVYKCWVCYQTHNTHGTLYSLIKKYGNEKFLKTYLLFKPEETPILTQNQVQIKLPKEFTPYQKVTNGLKLTTQYKQAINYLNNRKINEDIIDKFNIGFCFKGEYENRIIVPSYDKYGDLNYFIGRSYLTKPFLKYKNPEINKSNIIFNEYLIDWKKDVYIVEGVFDSFFLNNSIPLLGKYISDYLFKIIYENLKANLIIVLDPDAYDDMINLYHRLNCGKLMNRVFYVELTGNKDVADLCGNINDCEIKKIQLRSPLCL